MGERPQPPPPPLVLVPVPVLAKLQPRLLRWVVRGHRHRQMPTQPPLPLMPPPPP